MASRRRSRRLASQEPEPFSACSSTDVLEVGDDEQGKRTEEMKMETSQKQGQKDSSSQSSPVALRTRSRSRCSSMESNDAGIIGDIQKAVSIILTPKKNSTTPVKSCRKRTSLMPQLEEIVEEQPKCRDEDSNEERLMERKTETKKVLKKKEKLSEDERARVEVGKESSAKRSNKKGIFAQDVAVEKESVKTQGGIIENSWSKSKGSPNESCVKGSEKSLTRNTRKSRTDNSDHFLQDGMKISPAKNSETSLARIRRKSSVMISKESSAEKNPEEMLTNNSSNTTDYLEQEAKVVTETNLDEGSLNIWPKLDDLLSLWLRRSEQNILVDNIKKAYAFVNEVDTAVLTISQELITTNSEMIWQQIAYGNKKFHRYFAKTKHFLDVEIPTNKEPAEEQDDALSPATIPKFQDESSDGSEEDSTDLFNLTEDEVKRLGKDLDGSKISKHDDDNYNNVSNSEDDGVSKVSDRVTKKRWKSAIDDHFFSLAEMEEYLDKQEKGQAHRDENFFEQFDEDGDDLQNSQTDYHYTDFYESTNGVAEANGTKALSTKLKKSKTVSGKVDNHAEKKVTFADEITDDVDYKSDDDDSGGDGQETTVLLGQVDEEEDNETEFQHQQKKLQERIASIEQANLAPRSWDLSGEVTAIERGENTMLEKHLDFDQSAPRAPVITVDTTAQLEAKIVQRIKDRVFDDVLRTERKPGANSAYRAPVAESELVKKSLAEVYEEQYQKTQYGVGNEEKTNEKHEEIKKLMSDLFQKLNALSHYRYIPSEVRPEVRIISNMPSLQKEEVGPLASTDAVLLAPEEIHKHVSGPIKGDDEKTKTDRSRLHRKKKKWQHIRQFKIQEAELTSTKNEVPAKKSKLTSQYDSKKGNMKLTSTSFFQHLQTKATEEVKGKKNKVTEMGTTKKKLSTNYKL
ncbi:Mpp10 protein [Loa loa]|uniref:Mpp10 protein n=1 Tax=Loa loa TaxID=7209 RepID=A0A1S0TU93_LOALO|nr:Mpp10 protein [Loa loa]EFO20391.2 Mpp10 protein [Loa loa]